MTEKQQLQAMLERCDITYEVQDSGIWVGLKFRDDVRIAGEWIIVDKLCISGNYACADFCFDKHTGKLLEIEVCD